MSHVVVLAIARLPALGLFFGLILEVGAFGQVLFEPFHFIFLTGGLVVLVHFHAESLLADLALEHLDGSLKEVEGLFVILMRVLLVKINCTYFLNNLSVRGVDSVDVFVGHGGIFELVFFDESVAHLFKESAVAQTKSESFFLAEACLGQTTMSVLQAENGAQSPR